MKAFIATIYLLFLGLFFPSLAFSATFELNPNWSKEIIQSDVVFPDYVNEENKIISHFPINGIFPGFDIAHIHVSGPIEKGDLKTLEDFRNKFLTIFISMNSEGGNLYEALAISDFILENNITTLVWKGHKCFSSCALIFLSGRFQHREYIDLNRFLHIKGALGFHSPLQEANFLSQLLDAFFSDGNITREQFKEVMNYLVENRQNAIRELISRSGDWQVTEKLLYEAMGEGPNSFIAIDNAKIALREKIRVISTGDMRVTTMTQSTAYQVCEFAVFQNFVGSPIIYDFPYNEIGKKSVLQGGFAFAGRRLNFGNFVCVVENKGAIWQVVLRDAEWEFDVDGRLFYRNIVTLPMLHGLEAWEKLKISGSTKIPRLIVDSELLASPVDKSHYAAVEGEKSSSPSFNCKQAFAPDEIVICRHGKLGALDTHMAKLYGNLADFGISSRRKDLLSLQRQWLKRRASCGWDVDCLVDIYSQHVARLEAWNTDDCGGAHNSNCTADISSQVMQSMERAYRAALLTGTASQKRALHNSQEAWLDDNQRCNRVSNCLEERYKNRISHLVQLKAEHLRDISFNDISKALIRLGFNFGEFPRQTRRKSIANFQAVIGNRPTGNLTANESKLLIQIYRAATSYPWGGPVPTKSEPLSIIKDSAISDANRSQVRHSLFIGETIGLAVALKKLGYISDDNDTSVNWRTREGAASFVNDLGFDPAKHPLRLAVLLSSYEGGGLYRNFDPFSIPFTNPIIPHGYLAKVRNQ